MAESLDARLALQQAAQEGRLTWSQGVRAIRKAIGLTQAEFATAFGLTIRQLSELERGTANPTVKTLTRLAGPLGLTVGFIPTPKAKDAPGR
jgi:transcriptional regulator with XRE-family HTH domain